MRNLWREWNRSVYCGIIKDVKRLDYEDSLAVTDIDDILDYLYLLTNITSIEKLKRKDLKETLERKMVNGILNIPKEYGMFICRK